MRRTRWRTLAVLSAASVLARGSSAQEQVSERVKMERAAADDSAWIANAPTCQFPAMVDTTGWRRVTYGSDISFSLPPDLHDPTAGYTPNDSVHGDWWDSRYRYIMARRAWAQPPGRLRNRLAWTRCVSAASGSRLLIVADTLDSLPFFEVMRAPAGRLTPEWRQYFPLTRIDFGRFPHEETSLVLTIIQTMRWHSPPDSASPPVAGPFSSCRPVDEESTALLFHLKDVGTTTDTLFSASRDSARLPLLTPSMPFRQVTDAPLCSRAAGAFDSLVVNANPSQHDPARRIWLFQYGAFYVIGDPYVRMGEWFPMYVFDAKFRYVGAITF